MILKGTRPATMTERNNEIYRLHEEDKLSYYAIAKKCDISPGRVFEIIKLIRKRQKEVIHMDAS